MWFFRHSLIIYVGLLQGAECLQGHVDLLREFTKLFIESTKQEEEDQTSLWSKIQMTKYVGIVSCDGKWNLWEKEERESSKRKKRLCFYFSFYFLFIMGYYMFSFEPIVWVLLHCSLKLWIVHSILLFLRTNSTLLYMSNCSLSLL